MYADSGESAVNYRENPQDTYLVQHVAERSPHTLDSDESFYPAAARQNLAEQVEPFRHRFAGYGSSAEHQSRDRTPEQQHDRLFAPLEQRRDGDAQENTGQQIRDEKGDDVRRVTVETICSAVPEYKTG